MESLDFLASCTSIYSIGRARKILLRSCSNPRPDSGLGKISRRASLSSQKSSNIHAIYYISALVFRSSNLFNVARPSWAMHGARNRHSFHRIPALPPTKQSQELSLSSSDCHDLRHSPAHPCTGMRGLLEDGGLDLFKIG